MGFDVSIGNSYQYENKEKLRNIAKNILNNTGATSEATQKIIEKSVFLADKQMKDLYTNPQLSVLKASTQITLNNSLKETLKYLKTHAKYSEKYKVPRLGDLWKIVETKNNFENNEKNELYEYEIDRNAKNIFAA